VDKTARLLTFLAAFAMATVRADDPAKPFTRDQATAIIANARKILTPNGVEQVKKVRIGGIEQWVSIRGTIVEIRYCCTFTAARVMYRSR
jgi:hypothetical protein